MVVRDEPYLLLPVAAQMGPNWTFGEMGAVGTHWVNVWTPKVLNAHYGQVDTDGHPQAWIATAAKDLLIWFAPETNSTLQVEKLKHERTLNPVYNALNSWINLPMRAWYTRTNAQWSTGMQKGFTTVLMPHDPLPGAAVHALAGSIKLVQDTVQCTALTISDSTTTDLLVMQSAHGRPTTVAFPLPASIADVPSNPQPGITLTTDGEAALLTYGSDGSLVHIAARNVSSLSINRQTYLQASQPLSAWEHPKVM